SPRLADSWFNRGIAYIYKGDRDPAMAELSQAIALDPRHCMAHYNRGVIFKSRGEADRARPDFNRPTEINHRLAEAYMKRGRIRCDKGGVDGPLAGYDKAIKYSSDSSAAHPSGSYLVSVSNPVLAMAYNNRGVVFRDKGDMKGALDDFNRAIE